jgi:drug/metabolite transporter (DMT)-like permease
MKRLLTAALEGTETDNVKYEMLPTDSEAPSSMFGDLALSPPIDTRLGELTGSVISAGFVSTILAWGSIVMAVLSGSTIGPIFKYVEEQGVGAVMAASWRNQAMLIFLSPLAFAESVYEQHNKKPQVSIFSTPLELRYPLLVYVVLDGLAWAMGSSAWVVALQYTTTMRASVFASLSPIILALYQYFVGVQVTAYEWVGVIGAVLGICVIVSDGLFDVQGPATANMVLGDAICVCASFAFSFEVINRRNTSAYVPLFKVRTSALGIHMRFWCYL